MLITASETHTKMPFLIQFPANFRCDGNGKTILFAVGTRVVVVVDVEIITIVQLLLPEGYGHIGRTDDDGVLRGFGRVGLTGNSHHGGETVHNV